MSRRGMSPVRLALTLGLMFASAAPARAVETSVPAKTADAGPAAQPAVAVMVFVRADPSKASAAGFDGIEAQLRELSVDVVTAEPMGNAALATQAFRAVELARSHEALGTVWLAEDDAATLHVYVYDAKHRQLTSRTLARPDAAVREELAVVLRSAIQALIAGEATTLEPVTIPPPKPAPLPEPPKRPQRERLLRLLGAVAYSGTSYATGSFQHGLQLMVAGQLTSRGLIGLDGIWCQSPTLAGGGAQAVLDRYPVELFGGYAFADNPRFHAYAELGAQLELVRRSTRIADTRLMPLPDDSRLRLALSPRLRALLEPSKGLLVFAAFGADIATDRYNYVVQSASGPVRLAARTVRPRLEAGAAVRIW